MMYYEDNDLEYWFPKLQAIGVPVPRTEIVHAPPELTLADLTAPADQPRSPAYDSFSTQLANAAARVGYPCFLKTGFISHKHGWRKTCFVADPSQLIDHVAALAAPKGHPPPPGPLCPTWVIREFLELYSTFVAFDGMPVSKERRYFVDDGQIVCHHPYWVPPAIEGHTDCPDWREKLDALNLEHPAEVDHLTGMALRIAQEFEGGWSIDFAFTRSAKWYVIDMGHAQWSYHWPNCPKNRWPLGPNTPPPRFRNQSLDQSPRRGP